jgi:predicted GIY-YIG superfamily endonuclease
VYYLYQITCIHPDEYGKRYIGYTARPDHRKYTHFKSPFKRSHLHDAIRKYGVEWFEYKVLAAFDNRDRALAAEVGLIKRLGTKYPGGYNLIDVLRVPANSRRMAALLSMLWLKRSGRLGEYLKRRPTAQVYELGN